MDGRANGGESSWSQSKELFLRGYVVEPRDPMILDTSRTLTLTYRRHRDTAAHLRTRRRETAVRGMATMKYVEIEREFCGESWYTFMPSREATKESGTKTVARVVRPLEFERLAGSGEMGVAHGTV